MSKQLLFALIVAFVVVITVVIVVQVRKQKQKPATLQSVIETNKMPRLDTSPPKFPE